MAGMLCTTAVDLVGKGQTTTETHANAMLVFAAMMLRHKLRHAFATEAELWPFNQTPKYVQANTHRLVSDDHLLHLLSGHARQALPHLHGTDLTRQIRGNRKRESVAIGRHFQGEADTEAQVDVHPVPGGWWRKSPNHKS